ncbi:unnamed protein product [Didymodactylos carnosus]|uniref:Uncharacterized protein n=1 Tax=Didymodactylos carnosus TaxID=1234261 RepID=A0A814HCU0_9BILA|nr:unnamed protein product [Didymodactylos carnosus]CAF1071421.1 unnamed protein product [Didymodactylos carnosus]CAF3780159.1 unnamed protein product [Didymodactylos carnosus]CAF3835681.1 unnamed protein product [Didymodactylos carnosus]
MSKSHSREFFKKNKRDRSKKNGNNIKTNNNNHHLNNREHGSHNASTVGTDGDTDTGHTKEKKTKICCLL